VADCVCCISVFVILERDVMGRCSFRLPERSSLGRGSILILAKLWGVEKQIPLGDYLKGVLCGDSENCFFCYVTFGGQG